MMHGTTTKNKMSKEADKNKLETKGQKIK